MVNIFCMSVSPSRVDSECYGSFICNHYGSLCQSFASMFGEDCRRNRETAENNECL